MAINTVIGHNIGLGKTEATFNSIAALTVSAVQIIKKYEGTVTKTWKKGRLVNSTSGFVLNGQYDVILAQPIDIEAVFATSLPELSNITPAAPTAAVVNDAANTFDWTHPTGYVTADEEITTDGGITYVAATKPFTVAGAEAIGQVGVRVKAAAGRNVSATLFNATAFTSAVFEDNFVGTGLLSAHTADVGTFVVDSAQAPINLDGAGGAVFGTSRGEIGITTTRPAAARITAIVKSIDAVAGFVDILVRKTDSPLTYCFATLSKNTSTTVVITLANAAGEITNSGAIALPTFPCTFVVDDTGTNIIASLNGANVTTGSLTGQPGIRAEIGGTSIKLEKLTMEPI